MTVTGGSANLAEKMPEELKEIVFALDDRIEGRQLTLENTDIPTLRGFLDDVEALIKNDGRAANLANSRLRLETGSIRFVAFLTLVVALGIERDLGKLSNSPNLDQVSHGRAKILAKWQAKAQRSVDCSYSITIPGTSLGLHISARSALEHYGQNLWVPTQKYLTGEILDAGGKQDANLHLLFPDGNTITVSASKQQLRSLERNPVYRTMTVFVQAEQHLSTKALRNVVLKDFVQPAKPTSDELLENLWRRGNEAWADVSSPADWIEELRGNK